MGNHRVAQSHKPPVPRAPHLREAGLRAEIEHLKREVTWHQEQLQAQRQTLLENQRALEFSRAHFAELYDAAPIGHLTLDMRGCIRDINRKGAALLGAEQDALMGKPLMTLVKKEDHRRFLQHLARCRRGPAAVSAAVRLVPLGGSPLVVQLTSLAHPSVDEGATRIRIAMLDITARTKAEEQLARREAEFRAIFDGISDAVCFTDLKRRIIMVNEAFARLFGYIPAEVQGQSAALLYADEADYEDLGRRRYRLGIQPDRQPIQVRYRRKDGSVFVAESIGDHVRDHAGKVIGFVGVHRDITERKRAEHALERSERRFRALVEKASEFVTIVDAEGIVLYDSPAEPGPMGYAAEETIGKSILDLVHPDDRERARAEMRALAEQPGKSRRMELRLRAKDGSTRWLQAVGTNLLADPAVGGIVLNSRDITERKRAEELLKRALTELARSNEDLDQFASIVAHDLHEPLRMVSGFLRLLADQYRGKLDPKADEFIGFAVDGAMRMDALIDGLLAFSRIATRGRKPRPTDSAAALKQALANLQRAIAESGAEVTSEPLPVVSADETQLMEVFQNLLDNALKYRGAERPRVHISACDDEDSWLFCVQDNGIGIAQPDHERVFQVFKRLPSAAGVPGTGMGLALCKKIVERHKGRMWADSAPGKGSAFYFTLPKTGG